MGKERLCQVCEHLSRLAIDQAILNNKPLRVIAREFGIGSGQFGTPSFKEDHKKLSRHVERCMGEAYRAAKEADLEASGLALVNRMRQLDEIVDEVLERSREGEPILVDDVPLLNPDGSPMKRFKDTTLLAAIREARRNTELRAKLAGALPEGDEDAVAKARAALNSPAARRLVTELERTLADEAANQP